jgi:synaptic vesicle membrane protein VAT-1
MAQRWRLHSGNLANLTLENVPVPVVEVPEEVVVKVTHVGLNFADIFACLGLYSATPKEMFTPGLEFSGIVESVSDQAPHLFKKVRFIVSLKRSKQS